MSDIKTYPMRDFDNGETMTRDLLHEKIYRALVVGADKGYDGLWHEAQASVIQLAKLPDPPLRSYGECLREPLAPIETLTLRFTQFRLPQSSKAIAVWVPDDWPEDKVTDRLLEWFLLRELEGNQ